MSGDLGGLRGAVLPATPELPAFPSALGAGTAVGHAYLGDKAAPLPFPLSTVRPFLSVKWRRQDALLKPLSDGPGN